MLKITLNIRCPIDGKIFTGESYSGAWWRYLNEINAKSCHYLALLWLLTGEEFYRDLSKKILTEYAKYYPDYEEHGGIPHNGPEKANAQTLCEAIWIRSLAFGYDIIKDSLQSEEISFIENNLFTICGEFMMKHRVSQLHNHEVLVSGGIGILGILLNRKDMIDFAVNNKYGIKYPT